MRFPLWFPLQMQQPIKFMIAGIPGGLIALGLLRMLVEGYHVPSLLAAFVACTVSHAISFFPQKMWTFQDRSWSTIQAEAFKYSWMAVISIFMNTLMMNYAENNISANYMVDQIGVSLVLTILTFVVSKFFIFIKPDPESDPM